MLLREPDFSVKANELEKFRANELKKYEKLLKKE
jgi:hypothetical protein